MVTPPLNTETRCLSTSEISSAWASTLIGSFDDDRKPLNRADAGSACRPATGTASARAAAMNKPRMEAAVIGLRMRLVLSRGNAVARLRHVCDRNAIAEGDGLAAVADPHRIGPDFPVAGLDDDRVRRDEGLLPEVERRLHEAEFIAGGRLHRHAVLEDEGLGVAVINAGGRGHRRAAVGLDAEAPGDF